MQSARYFFDDGHSRKFWSFCLRGKTQTICHGRLGATGRETKKTFPTAAVAATETEKLVNQKLKKGYVPIDPSGLQIQRPKGKRRATESQIVKLEKQLDATLPLDYREFLLTQNGGIPEPYFVRIPGHPYIDNVAVGFLYGLYAQSDPRGLLAACQQAEALLPVGQVPIAGDSDIFSISLRQKPGCVYFWDHEAAECEDEDEDGTVSFKMSQARLLAGSFNEFLTRISIFEQDA